MTLVVCPLHEVDEAIRRWKPSHMIGMASPGAEVAVVEAGIERLHLTFNDIAEPRPGLRAPCVADVGRLLEFARAWPREAPLLIQCWAGVSRSPAAAYVIACARSEPGQEVALADRLRGVAPFATPNRRIVELADGLLSRRGRMIDEIARIGRGEEVSAGRTFCLTSNAQTMNNAGHIGSGLSRILNAR